MVNSVITGKEEVVEGELIPTDKPKALSQHQEDLLQDERGEFSSDDEIVGDWLQSKSDKTAQTYFSTIKQFHTFSGNIAITQWSKKLILAYIANRKE